MDKSATFLYKDMEINMYDFLEYYRFKYGNVLNWKCIEDCIPRFINACNNNAGEIV